MRVHAQMPREKTSWNRLVEVGGKTCTLRVIVSKTGLCFFAICLQSMGKTTPSVPTGIMIIRSGSLTSFWLERSVLKMPIEIIDELRKTITFEALR